MFIAAHADDNSAANVIDHQQSYRHHYNANSNRLLPLSKEPLAGVPILARIAIPRCSPVARTSGLALLKICESITSAA
jgi:hypothetical protein